MLLRDWDPTMDTMVRLILISFSLTISFSSPLSVASYLRDLFAGTCVYWITAGLWHITIYYILGHQLFTSKGRPFPETSVIIDQILLAQSSIFVYAGLPVISELLIENNYTKIYFYISDIGGWQYYFFYLFLYVVFFEIGIYWMHRKLHTNKFLYKYIHGLHHKYNKHETLTPWASIAFNPIDGMLQASPYVVGLFFIPVHYLTHVFLLFFSGVWATCIHDSVPAATEPIMGAAYHTIHHTHYHYNFGQVSPSPALSAPHHPSLPPPPPLSGSSSVITSSGVSVAQPRWPPWPRRKENKRVSRR
jgi:Delta7-sterol 5-desaturase